MSIKNDIVVIDETPDSEYTGLTCKVCEYVLVTAKDISNARNNGCCSECWLVFGEREKDKWKAGKRPDEKTLNRYKLKRRILNIDLFDILGE